MPWTHVTDITKGMITSTKSSQIDRGASPFIKGCYIKDGEVCSDFGMVDFPSPSSTKTNALLGTVMKIDSFNLFSGLSHLMAITTRHLYQYNTVSGTWDVVTLGILLDSCESTFTASSNVTSTADPTIKLRGTNSSKNVIATAFTTGIVSYRNNGSAKDISGATNTHLSFWIYATVAKAEDVFRIRLSEQNAGGTGATYFDFTIPALVANTWQHVSVPISAPVAGGAGAGIDSFTVLMLHGDGIDAATVITDSSSAAHSVTVAGDAQIDDAQAKFDQSIIFDGTGDYLSTPDSEDFNYGASNFTIDFWLRPAVSLTSFPCGFYEQYVDGGNRILLSYEAGAFYFQILKAGSVLLNASYTVALATTTWQHVALVRSGNNFRLYLNGVLVNTRTAAITVPNLAVVLNIGRGFFNGSYQYLNGHIDEFRISKGIARWTAAFTPATGAYSDPGASSTLNAVLSVALVANSDPGVVTVYLDDIRTAKEFTGDEDNRFSFTTQRDVGIISNGIDAPTKITDSSGIVHEALTLSLPSGALTTSEVVLAFKDHVIYMNNTENGADVPQRASWSNIGTVNDMVTGTAGFQDLTDDDSWIVGAAILSENEVAIYKERSIVQCVWVGGHTPFRFTTTVLDKGAIGKDCIAKVSGYHIVADINTVFVYKGTNDIQSIDDPIKSYLYNRIDGTYESRSFMFVFKEWDEVQFWIPVSETTPDEGWTFKFGTPPSWYVKSRNISAFGFYQTQSSLTIGDLTMTIGEMNFQIGSTLQKTFSPITLVGDVNGQIYKLDESTLNNDGVAITNEFQTPDFILPDTKDNLNHYMRVAQLIYESSGQSITTEYSTDSGLSWRPTMGNSLNTQTLSSVVSDYQQDFESNTKKIRFRFKNTSLSSGFKLRSYGFYWQLRSNRR